MSENARLEVERAVAGSNASLPAKVCAKFDYPSVDLLLFHYPRRYEDRTRWIQSLSMPIGELVTIKGRICAPKLTRWRGGRACFELTLELEGGFQNIRLIWFGLSYLKNQLTPNKELIAYGKLALDKKGLVIHHPEYEFLTDEDQSIHTGRITPIYPLTEGVSQKMVRAVLFHQVCRPTFNAPEIYPAPGAMMSRTQALRAIHFPASFQELEAARARLVFDELLRIQMILTLRSRKLIRIHKPRSVVRQDLVDALRAKLPFALTRSQQKACKEIDADLGKAHPMNRLLQGDVGSGKTLVAVHALLRTLEAGKNGALLAPTEILAEQHFLNLTQWLAPLGIDVELRTRSKKISYEDGLFSKNGKIFVGTHALIQEKIELPNLGLGVIDEQHKFGVLQRLAFQKKAYAPDVLVMTATPIPRTLCLTLYGDLDISILDELPPGRGSLRTFLRTEKELPKVFNFVEKQIGEGRQVYVVYPLVEESEKLDLKSVEKAAQLLRDRFGAKQVGVLHGKMESGLKEETMRRFKNKEFSILVSTTVIEVGVDVPNAAIMIIEHAERFGLAQLHQLRGRVGRGVHASYCILIGDSANIESWERLKIMEKTSNGFVIAEEDLNIRGPGDILGTDQSGFPPLKLAHLIRDAQVIGKAREFAQELLKHDESLKKWPEFRKELEELDSRSKSSVS